MIIDVIYMCIHIKPWQKKLAGLNKPLKLIFSNFTGMKSKCLGIIVMEYKRRRETEREVE